MLGHWDVVRRAAGIAGMQALISAKSGAVLGVLVSVTTIPAAGDVAVALAYGLSRDPTSPAAAPSTRRGPPRSSSRATSSGSWSPAS